MQSTKKMRFYVMAHNIRFCVPTLTLHRNRDNDNLKYAILTPLKSSTKEMEDVIQVIRESYYAISRQY